MRSPCPALSTLPSPIRSKGLSLPKAEESMTVPVRSGHRLGDLGQAAEGLAIPGEARLENHDPFELAVPFSRQQRAGLEDDAIPGHGRPPVEGSGGILIPATANVNRRLIWAEVVAVGPTVRNITEGDRVLFAPDAGYEVEIRGEDYLILRERDIHAVAASRIEGSTGLYL